ncbi:hypothetical protein ACQKGO_25215 [Corallococcus interemptor]|uniref:hypothetical protein n=1 Tax=Corallococcus interemptor TaxID=2316720 RepID=UPI003D05274D
MHIESPRSARSRKAVTFLRIPVLLAVGMMTMGSGMGNPGCNSGPSGCDEGCAIAGTYQLQFTDSSPPGQDCEAWGLGLHTGPMVLAFDNPNLTTTLNDAEVRGLYYGEPYYSVFLYGSQRLPGSNEYYAITIDAEVTSPAPNKGSAPSVIEGEYKLELSPYGDAGTPGCLIQRHFTATRR